MTRWVTSGCARAPVRDDAATAAWLATASTTRGVTSATFREAHCSERVRGIEPPYLAWEASALPLSYTREVRRATLPATPDRLSSGFTVAPPA
jgi:hypothetical protein